MADNKQDRQIDPKVKAIFDSLYGSNVSSNIYMNILKDTKNPKLAQYIPKRVLEDSSFIKELIDSRLINYYDIPNQFKNQEYISKKYYEFQLMVGCVSLKENIYPQDQKIVISAIKGDRGTSKEFTNLNFVEPAFLDDKLCAYEMISIDHSLISKLPQKTVKALFRDEDLVCKLLQKDVTLYNKIPELDQTKKEYLMIMLGDNDNSMGYLYCRTILKKVKDIDVTLLALKKHNDALNYIHQNYSRIIVAANQQNNAYSFLKSYLLSQKMNKDLSNAQSTVKRNKL